MTIEERIRSYSLVALSNTLNGPDPDSDIDKMYIPDQYNRALYQTIIHDLMQHLAAHALSGSSAMDVYTQWTEMYEGQVIDRGPESPPRGPNDYDF
jgi:hypothetical protein